MRLGYARYGAQGGDWGALVTSELALRHAPKLADCISTWRWRCPCTATARSPTPRGGLAVMAQWQAQEAGYQGIQGSKPQTLATG